MNNEFNMCPMCGSKAIKTQLNKKWFCSDCGFDLYCNVAASVGVVIMDKENKILLETRAKEPRKGYLALPGGFIDPDERAEDAVVRECKEEIGVEVSNVRFICTYPNTYEYKNIVYKTCDMFFLAPLPEQFKNIEEYIGTLKAQETEVSGFSAWKVETKEDIDKIPLAFESARETLYTLLKRKNK